MNEAVMYLKCHHGMFIHPDPAKSPRLKIYLISREQREGPEQEAGHCSLVTNNLLRETLI